MLCGYWNVNFLQGSVQLGLYTVYYYYRII
jgi:hypothetical protein